MRDQAILSSPDDPVPWSNKWYYYLTAISEGGQDLGGYRSQLCFCMTMQDDWAPREECHLFQRSCFHGYTGLSTP